MSALPSLPALRPLDDILLPYQRRWAGDDSRLKIGKWARQTGKSTSCMAEAVADCLVTPRAEWTVLSAGERQALKTLDKAKIWAECCKLALDHYSETRDSSQALMRQADIRFGNGSTIQAIPANPDTARGYSSNLVLDEFAHHEKPEQVWRAIYPSITNQFGGVKKLRIVSTPNGRNNKFYDVWLLDNYSHHTVTITQAVAEGLPVDVEELRKGFDDPMGWAQEFDPLDFADGSSVLLPYELIGSCEHSEATESTPWEWWEETNSPIYLGIDVGRKHDLTVGWACTEAGDTLWTSEVLPLRNTPIPDQFEILSPRVAIARRTCIDYTGLGVGLGDLLVKAHGEWKPEEDKYGKVELCTFTPKLKQQVFPHFRLRFERGKIRVPISRVIREDLHSVHRIATVGGVTYRAPRSNSDSEKTEGYDGHADRCTAGALCVRAAVNVGIGVFALTI